YWLARYFMDNGWSVKKLHRLIMLSAVYQQGSSEGALQGGRISQTPPRPPHPNPLPLGGGEGEAPATKVKLETLPAADRTPTLRSDPENKLLWHMNCQRLDFESLRDSLLCVSGQLDPQLGGRAEE